MSGGLPTLAEAKQIGKLEKVVGKRYAVLVHAKLKTMKHPSSRTEQQIREQTAVYYWRNAEHHFGIVSNYETAVDLGISALASYMLAGAKDDKIHIKANDLAKMDNRPTK